MKTKSWIFLFLAIALICAALSVWLLRVTEANTAQIYQNGELLKTVDLSRDQTFTVTNGSAKNTVAVKDGKISVTYATCPDQYCVQKGWHNSGAPIVCLPNRLVISFSERETDAISG